MAGDIEKLVGLVGIHGSIKKLDYTSIKRFNSLKVLVLRDVPAALVSYRKYLAAASRMTEVDACFIRLVTTLSPRWDRRKGRQHILSNIRVTGCYSWLDVSQLLARWAGMLRKLTVCTAGTELHDGLDAVAKQCTGGDSSCSDSDLDSDSE